MDPQNLENLEKEVRFALVMYGGVSLAVYINGVSQEFYSLVHATSADGAAGQAGRSRTEAVYRKLGAILGATGADLTVDPATARIRTRFVVDILSGTSAGGLNSIFLAKALAKNLDFGVIEKLWVDQADIATLMNDGDSPAAVSGGFTLHQQKPPQSLLSSERMYALLLSALGEMDSNTSKDPLVREVDLFVTATDLRGLEMRLKLADEVVLEKRHRNVFHFCASPYLTPATPSPSAPQDTGAPDTRNDFDEKYNPFLAFAGRCTAAFPIAFEPMRLADIDAVLDRCTPLKNDASARSTSAAWRPFIVDYIPQDDDSPPGLNQVPYRFRNRAFADGGYLNNKPFSSAIEELGVRGGSLPYDRKLVYIEPSPESVKEQGSDAAKPDAIENAFDAAFALPRYQTIREDLRHVVERNRLVTRLQEVIDQLEETVAQSNLSKTFERESAEDFARKKLSDLELSRGPLYAGYHQLKVRTVIDELCRTIGAALDLDESSDELRALYFVMRAWVHSTYQQESSDPRKTESRFLLKFDLSYRERRLYFLLSRLDALYARDKKAEIIEQSTGIAALFKNLSPEEEEAWKKAIRLLRGNRLEKPSPAKAAATDQGHAEATAQASAAKNAHAPATNTCPVHQEKCPVGHGLVPVVGFLRRERNVLRQRGTLNPLERAKPDRQKWRQWLGSLLKGTDLECESNAQHLFTSPEHLPLRKQLIKMLAVIDREMKNDFICAAGHIDKLLGLATQRPAEFEATAVLHYCLRKLYDSYDFYDAVSFPILYGTDAGSLKVTAVHRISPRDATSLIDEAKDPQSRTKLAGDSLGAFGAFFQKSWRKNDLMWGRLDGAERIIGMLLPGSDDATKTLRDQLIREAQGGILSDCLHTDDLEKLFKAVVDQVASEKTGESEISLAQAILQQPDHAARIRAFVEPGALVDYVRNSYAIDKTFQPQWALPIAARAAKVAGQMLEFLSGERKWRAGPVVWVVRVTRLFWGIVEVAIPQSISYATFRYVLRIYGLAAILVLITGFFLGQPALMTAAWKMLLTGLAVWVVVQLFHEAMSGNNALWRVLRLLLIALLALLILGGLIAGVSAAPFWYEYIRLLALLLGPTPEGLLRWLAIAAGATLLAGIATSFPGFSENSRKAAAKTPAAKPVLTMELAHTPALVRSILATRGDRSSMRLVQNLDFALIASYVMFFSLAAAFEVRAWAANAWIAASAAVAGLAAAVFDILENRSILLTLHLEANAIKPARVNRTRHYAVRKWALLAFAELLLSAGAFLAAAPYTVAPGFGAVLGMAGIAGLAGCRWPRLLWFSIGGLGIVVLASLLFALGLGRAAG